MRFRVLVIPGQINGDLNLAEEMLRLANLGNNSDKLYVETLTPRSKEIDIVGLLQKNKFDCLHFLGHSDGETFVLSSGDVLDEDHILSLCRDAEARVLFMNSCLSASLCQYAVNTTVAVALAWVGQVVDDAAIVAAMRFYNALSDFGDPWGSGLRRSYEAVGEKRKLLWLTDGEYVTQMIAPIIARLDKFDVERKEAFNLFSGRLDLIIQGMKDISNGVASGLSRVTKSYGKIRILLYAIAVMVIATMVVLGYSLMASAQTIPPDNGTIPTALPGCNESGGQPEKCQQTETPTFIPTDPPTSTPKPTNTKERPTDTPDPTSTPTNTPKPTDTKEHTPTNTPKPTNTKERPTVALPTVTPTPTEVLPPCP